MMRWIVRSSLHFRFIVVALAVGMVAFGATRVSNMPVDVFPEFAPPVRRGPDRGPRDVDRGGRDPHHDPDGAGAQLDARARHDALDHRPGPVGDHADLRPRHRSARGPPARERARRNGDPEPAGVGRHPVDAPAALRDQPGDEDRAHVRPLRPDRPLDDRLLDDALAADGGSGRRERRHLGRPLEAAPVPDGPGQAPGPQHDDRRRDVGRLGRARLRAPEVHGRRQEPGRRLHRDPEPAARHPPRAAGVHAAAACERHRVGQAERRRVAARARRPRDDGVGPPAALRRRGDQRPPGPAHGGREVPVGEHARRHPRGRPGARPDAARACRGSTWTTTSSGRPSSSRSRSRI